MSQEFCVELSSHLWLFSWRITCSFPFSRSLSWYCRAFCGIKRIWYVGAPSILIYLLYCVAQVTSTSLGLWSKKRRLMSYRWEAFNFYGFDFSDCCEWNWDGMADPPGENEGGGGGGLRIMIIMMIKNQHSRFMKNVNIWLLVWPPGWPSGWIDFANKSHGQVNWIVTVFFFCSCNTRYSEYVITHFSPLIYISYVCVGILMGMPRIFILEDLGCGHWHFRYHDNHAVVTHVPFASVMLEERDSLASVMLDERGSLASVMLEERDSLAFQTELSITIFELS